VVSEHFIKLQAELKNMRGVAVGIFYLVDKLNFIFLRKFQYFTLHANYVWRQTNKAFKVDLFNTRTMYSYTMSFEIFATNENNIISTTSPKFLRLAITGHMKRIVFSE